MEVPHPSKAAKALIRPPDSEGQFRAFVVGLAPNTNAIVSKSSVELVTQDAVIERA
jgi:hypothetical protein